MLVSLAFGNLVNLNNKDFRFANYDFDDMRDLKSIIGSKVLKSNFGSLSSTNLQLLKCIFKDFEVENLNIQASEKLKFVDSNLEKLVYRISPMIEENLLSSEKEGSQLKPIEIQNLIEETTNFYLPNINLTHLSSIIGLNKIKARELGQE